MIVPSTSSFSRNVCAAIRSTTCKSSSSFRSVQPTAVLNCFGTITGSINDEDTKYRRRYSSQPPVIQHHNFSLSIPSIVSLGVINHNDTGFSNIRSPLLRLSLSSHSHKTHHHNQQRTFFSFGGGKKPNDPSPPPNNTTNTDGGESVATPPPTTWITDEFVDDTTTTMTTTTTTTTTEDETAINFFQEEDVAIPTATSDTGYSTVDQSVTDAASGAIWDPVWYNVADNAILMINAVQHYSELPYGMSIILTTVLLRMGLFPLMIQEHRAESRLAHVRSELPKGYRSSADPNRIIAYPLVAKYKYNRLYTDIAPVVQLSLFISMLLGLKKISQYFPVELKSGGMLWFPDLSVPDPLYILPLLSSATFFILLELNKEENVKGGKNSESTLNLSLFISIMSLSVFVNFEASMVLYVVLNNILECTQIAILKSKAVRKRFGILDPPKATSWSDPFGKLERKKRQRKF